MEQIVEGQTLVMAVPKSYDFHRQNDVDIYETINRFKTSNQSGSRAIINDSGVSKRGHLYKKGLLLSFYMMFKIKRVLVFNVAA